MPIEPRPDDASPHLQQPDGPPASSTPDGLPVLGRGRHASASEGACLMEYTSVLAGVRFSDHPSCTAPTLAVLARLVNDATSDAARPQLSRCAVELSLRPRLTAHESALVVADVLVTAADALAGLAEPRFPTAARIRRLRRQSRRELARATAGDLPWVRATETLHRGGAARIRLEYAVRCLDAFDQPERDRVLARLLTGALTSPHLTGVPVPGPAAVPGPRPAIPTPRRTT